MRGEVWLYRDEDSKKNRPMVIIKGSLGVEIDVTFCKITSQKAQDEYDHYLEKWEEYGLKMPSTVRCSKICTISKRNLLFKVAKIPEDEMTKILSTVTTYIMS